AYLFTGNATVYAQWGETASMRHFISTGTSNVTDGDVTGTVKVVVASGVPQIAKIVVVALQDYADSGASAITLPLKYNNAMVIVSPEWVAAELANPTVLGDQLTMPNIGSSLSTV